MQGINFRICYLFQAHEFDDCRFDVGINDCLWYLRASSSEERMRWMQQMELHKVWPFYYLMFTCKDELLCISVVILLINGTKWGHCVCMSVVGRLQLTTSPWLQPARYTSRSHVFVTHYDVCNFVTMFVCISNIVPQLSL